jgi:hypothetical protein
MPVYAAENADQMSKCAVSLAVETVKIEAVAPWIGMKNRRDTSQ